MRGSHSGSFHSSGSVEGPMKPTGPMKPVLFPNSVFFFLFFLSVLMVKLNCINQKNLSN